MIIMILKFNNVCFFFYLFLLFLISGIHVNVLDDIQKAIEYCEQVYNSNSKDKNKVRFISHDPFYLL